MSTKKRLQCGYSFPCSRHSNLEHVFTQITPRKRGSGIRSWAPFFVWRTQARPPPPHSFFSFWGIGIVSIIAEKSKKSGFSPSKFSPSPLSTSCAALPMPSPEKSQAKPARAAENTALFKQMSTFFGIAEQHAQLNVCPRREGHEGLAGESPGKKKRPNRSGQCVRFLSNADTRKKF